MKSYVYTITFPSGSIYVGKANDPEKRWGEHRSMAKSEKRSALYNSLRKYKTEAVFQLVFSALSEEGAFWAERLFISEVRRSGVCLNHTDGGEGCSGAHSPERVSKRAAARRRQFCVRGHDTWVCGRAHRGNCRECHREISRAYRRKVQTGS